MQCFNNEYKYNKCVIMLIKNKLDIGINFRTKVKYY